MTALAGYNGVYDGLNFNGYGKGQVLVIVPRGWRVIVRCVDSSASVRHSCAIVRGVGATTPAFQGASSPDPEQGLAPGRSARFAFIASRAGVYRLASLVPDQEQAGMWDVFEVTRSGRPTVRQLRH